MPAVDDAILPPEVDEAAPPAGLVRPLTLAFFASGAAGLIFETLWFYQAGLALGNSYWAASLVLAAFMGGLALGNLLSTLRKPSAHSLRTYLKLELLIAVTGPLVVLLFPQLGRISAPLAGLVMDHPALVNALRFLLAFGALIVPSTAMGMTLPIFTQALSSGRTHYGRTLGRFYGVNTLGAVAGVLAGEYLLIGWLGIRGTAAAAACLNLVAALVAWLLSARIGPSAAVEEAPRRVFPAGVGLLWLPIGLSGFTLLALEVLWVRFLSLYVATTSRVFALMLAIVLLGIAAGGLAGSALLRRVPEALRSAGHVLFISGALCVLSYALFPWIQRPLAGIAVISAGDVLRLGAPLMFPVSLLSGLFFTLAGAEIRGRFQSSQGSAGALTLVNTGGAVLGPLVTGFLLIPRLGMEASFFILSAIYGVAALLWWAGSRARGPRAWAGLALWAASLAFFPFGSMQSRLIPQSSAQWTGHGQGSIVAVREGLTETLLYVESRQFGQRLGVRMVTNSFSMSSTFSGSRRYMKEYVYWPMALHPDPKRALLICFGVGNTAKALADSKALNAIDIVDISRDVLGMSRIVFPDPAGNPQNDPRVRVHMEDGRYFLQTTRNHYDLITGEPPPPPSAGVVSLYTREYFQLMRDRLNDQGIVTYWLPFNQIGEDASRSIIKAFNEVFETSFLWHGTGYNLMLVGVKGRLPQASLDHFSRQWKDPVVGPEMAAVGFENPAQFGAGFIGDGSYLKQITQDAAPLVDDFPKRIITERGATEPLYRSWIDTEAAKRRFVQSPSIAAMWPQPLLAATLPYFPFEGMVTTMGNLARPHGVPDFSEVHRLIQGSPLAEPILWILGSADEQQEAIAQLPLEARGTTSVQFHLGARSLAERQFRAAADHFKQAAMDPKLSGVSEPAYLYALCMDGRQAEARSILEAGGPTLLQSLPHGFLQWLEQTFKLGVHLT